jgi:hypothetical protein
MADWLNIAIVVDDATPNIASLTINGEVFEVTAGDGITGANLLTLEEYWQTVGGFVARAMSATIDEIMSQVGENPYAQLSVDPTLGVWYEQPLIYDPYYVTEDPGEPTGPVTWLVTEVTESNLAPFYHGQVITFNINIANNTGSALSALDLDIDALDATNTPTWTPPATTLADGADVDVTVSLVWDSADGGIQLHAAVGAELPGAVVIEGISSFVEVISVEDITLLLSVPDPPISIPGPSGFTGGDVIDTPTDVTNDSGVDLTGIALNVTHDGAGTITAISTFDLLTAATVSKTITYNSVAGDSGNTVTITVRATGDKPDTSEAASILNIYSLEFL